MKQVIQDFKTGELSVAEVPPPALARGYWCSIIFRSLAPAPNAPGLDRQGLAPRQSPTAARSRPPGLRNPKKKGIAETLKRVRTKLETLGNLAIVPRAQSSPLSTRRGDPKAW